MMSSSVHSTTSILIVGGAGFVGQALCSSLISQGAKVSVLDLHQNTTTVPGVDYITADATDKDALCRAIIHCQAEVVIHMASCGMSGAGMLNRRSLVVNVKSAEALVEACIACSVQRIVYTSSYNVVFGGQEVVQGTEVLPYFPLDQHTDYYSKSKAIAEMTILNANGASCLNGKPLLTTALRPAAIYGEHEQRHFPRIIRLMDNGLLFFTVGSATVDWVHIDNLTQAFLLVSAKILKAKTPSDVSCGRAYFISDGTPVHSWEFLRPVCLAVGCEYPPLNLPIGLMLAVGYGCERIHLILKGIGLNIEPFCTRAEVLKVGRTHYFSISKAATELGYAPTVTTDEGSKRMAAHYRRHLSNAHYFRTAPFIICSLILFGLAALAIIAFDLYRTEDLLKQYLINPLLLVGLTLFGSRRNLQYVWYWACSMHVLETGVAAYAMRGRGYAQTWLLWLGQTLLLGYPSLRLILVRNRFVHDVAKDTASNTTQ